MFDLCDHGSDEQRHGCAQGFGYAASTHLDAVLGRSLPLVLNYSLLLSHSSNLNTSESNMRGEEEDSISWLPPTSGDALFLWLISCRSAKFNDQAKWTEEERRELRRWGFLLLSLWWWRFEVRFFLSHTLDLLLAPHHSIRPKSKSTGSSLSTVMLSYGYIAANAKPSLVRFSLYLFLNLSLSDFLSFFYHSLSHVLFFSAPVSPWNPHHQQHELPLRYGWSRSPPNPRAIDWFAFCSF